MYGTGVVAVVELGAVLRRATGETANVGYAADFAEVIAACHGAAALTGDAAGAVALSGVVVLVEDNGGGQVGDVAGVEAVGNLGAGAVALAHDAAGAAVADLNLAAVAAAENLRRAHAEVAGDAACTKHCHDVAGVVAVLDGGVTRDIADDAAAEVIDIRYITRVVAVADDNGFSYGACRLVISGDTG